MIVLWWSATFFVGLAIGGVAAWFLLPQPGFMTRLWARLGLVDRVP